MRHTTVHATEAGQHHAHIHVHVACGMCMHMCTCTCATVTLLPDYTACAYARTTHICACTGQEAVAAHRLAVGEHARVIAVPA